MATKAKHYSRPDHAFIGLHTYTIEWLTSGEWEAERYDETKMGMHWATEQRISIRILANSNESCVAETLMHELLHACWYTSGTDDTVLSAIKDSEREEYIVNSMSPMMLMILRMNPHVVEYLSKCDGDQVR